MKPKSRTVFNAESWIIENDSIELSLTKQGGMMAPVVFMRNSGEPVDPYYVSPWQGEGLAIDEPVLEKLRGDFFCLPFGAGSSYRGESHDTHGEPASALWTFERYEQSGKRTSFEASLKTTVRPGTIRKQISLLDGHNVIYSSHRLSGFQGRTSLGHHATLAGGATPGRMLLQSSPRRLAVTDPRSPGAYSGGEYYALAPGAEFEELRRVPTIWSDKPHTDCSIFPNRAGFVDILALCQEPRDSEPAWITASIPSEGYLWFALKDPSMLPTTLFWMENVGRHQAPWNGRNCCIGIEDVCGFLAHGLAESSEENLLSSRGIPTSVALSDSEDSLVHYVQGVARIPDGFYRVERVEFASDEVIFISEEGKEARAPVRLSHVFDGSAHSV